MATLVAFKFIPDHAPITTNVSYVADHRVRSERVPGVLQGQVCPAQYEGGSPKGLARATINLL